MMKDCFISFNKKVFFKEEWEWGHWSGGRIGMRKYQN
jgi:hypothetical protein